MKNTQWLVRIIIGFTSITTFSLLSDNTLFGVIRGFAGAVVLDWLIEYWSGKRITLFDKKQRDWSNGMMWAGVVLVFAMAILWAIEKYVPVDAVDTYAFLGYSYALSLHDYILMLAQGMIGGWAVLTLGVTLFLQQIDPEVKRDIERSKALEEQEKEHTKAYTVAMRGIQRTVGTEKAFEAMRKQLESEGYTESRIESLLAQAQQEVKRDRGEAVDAPIGKVYESETVFTQPSTPKK